MTIKLKGSTDGSVSFTAPADTSPTGSDITLTLPTTAGSANQFVKNSGTAGTLEYSSMIEDSNNKVCIGTTTAPQIQGTMPFTISGDSFETAGQSIARYGDSAFGPLVILGHARGSESSKSIVQDGDEFGKIRFVGYDGDFFDVCGVEIKAAVDGTPGSNDMPGRLMFFTTPDGSDTQQERMRIDKNGLVDLKAASDDGQKFLKFSLDRGWHFKQISTGSSTKLGLYSETNKSFEIGGETLGTPTMTVAPGNSTVSIHGTLTKTSGSFRIPHPLPSKTDTHDLVHSFVEAPDASNLYAGMVDLVDGTATVNIDTAHRMTEGTFEALNTIQSWSSSNESGYAPVKCSVSGNILTIECQDTTSTDTVYYEVRGIRKDQHMLDTSWTDENGRVITEPLKFTGETEDPE